MHLKFRSIFGRLIGNPRDLPLERRIFHLVSLVCSILLFVFTLFNMVAGLGAILIVATGLYSALFGWLYYLGRYRDRPYPVYFLLLAFSILPVAYFTSGGMEGSTGYAVIIAQIVLLSIIGAGRHLWVTLLLIAEILIMFGIELWRPEWVQAYPSARARQADILAGLLFAVTVLGLLFYQLRRTYDEAMEAVESRGREVEKAARARMDFLSTMSHEIRTPMSLVTGMVRLLLDNDPRDDQIADLKTLDFSARNLLALLNDVLDYNKIEAGEIEIEAVEFAPRELIAEVVEFFRLRAREKNLTIQGRVGREVPEWLRGDSLRLTQVLMNLVGNAVKFTEAGGVELSLEGPADDFYQFAITDTGIGIPADSLEKIFSEFYQTKYTRKYGGTGLGLAITRKLIELQNGTIKAESRLGEGSRFVFTIPYAKGDGPSRAPILHASTPSPGRRILVVDDFPDNLTLVRRFLANRGLELSEATSGKDALALARKDPFHLVLMDIEMPEMNGYETASALRKIPGFQNVPILALTANAMPEQRHRAKDAGMNDVITKPFSPDELLRKINDYLNRAHY